MVFGLVDIMNVVISSNIISNIDTYQTGPSHFYGYMINYGEIIGIINSQSSTLGDTQITQITRNTMSLKTDLNPIIPLNNPPVLAESESGIISFQTTTNSVKYDITASENVYSNVHLKHYGGVYSISVQDKSTATLLNSFIDTNSVYENIISAFGSILFCENCGVIKIIETGLKPGPQLKDIVSIQGAIWNYF